jgi:hypothetical protein
VQIVDLLQLTQYEYVQRHDSGAAPSCWTAIPAVVLRLHWFGSMRTCPDPTHTVVWEAGLPLAQQGQDALRIVGSLAAGDGPLLTTSSAGGLQSPRVRPASSKIVSDSTETPWDKRALCAEISATTVSSRQQERGVFLPSQSREESGHTDALSDWHELSTKCKKCQVNSEGPIFLRTQALARLTGVNDNRGTVTTATTVTTVTPERRVTLVHMDRLNAEMVVGSPLSQGRT